MLLCSGCKYYTHGRAAVHSCFLIPHEIKECRARIFTGWEPSEALSPNGARYCYQLSYSWKSLLEGNRAGRRRLGSKVLIPPHISLNHNYAKKRLDQAQWTGSNCRLEPCTG